ncbi:MAG: bis(5'-nucleosyl)-tetraphosphatase (symmetrical) YqeK [Spirochaetales bacterium]|nr:bis(5'-nucleosyl)-tetraphosphatase (symmetrical) YqeK [Spirochaetales bacterium]
MDKEKNSRYYNMICDYILRHLSEKRRLHCTETGRLAHSLALRYGASGAKALLAGTAHDMAREMPAGEMVTCALRDGFPLRKWEKKHPVLVHGRAAAVILRDMIGIDEEDVLDAVRMHTFGGPDMGIIAKVVYIADYMEPTRNFLADDYRQALLEEDITRILLFVTEEKIRHVKKKGRKVIGMTKQLYRSLKGGKAKA